MWYKHLKLASKDIIIKENRLKMFLILCKCLKNEVLSLFDIKIHFINTGII